MTVDKAMLERVREALDLPNGVIIGHHAREAYRIHADLRALLSLVTPLVERDAGLVERVARGLYPNSNTVPYADFKTMMHPHPTPQEVAAHAAITAILEGK